MLNGNAGSRMIGHVQFWALAVVASCLQFGQAAVLAFEEPSLVSEDGFVSGESSWTDADVRRLPFSKARVVSLAETKVTDEGIKYFESSTKLEYLILTETRVSDACFPTIATLPNLVSLVVDKTQVTGEKLHLLGDDSKLRYLDLSYCKLHASAIDGIAKLRQLEGLWLSGTNVTDKDVEPLTGLGELASVDLRYTAVGDRCALALSRMKSIEWLNLRRTAVTDEALSHVKALPRLRSLDLTHNGITDEGVRHLRGHECLESLDLGDTDISSASLGILTEIPKLRFVEVPARIATPDSVRVLTQCKNLRKVFIVGSRDDDILSDPQVADLRRALPGIEVQSTRIISLEEIERALKAAQKKRKNLL